MPLVYSPAVFGIAGCLAIWAVFGGSGDRACLYFVNWPGLNRDRTIGHNVRV